MTTQATGASQTRRRGLLGERRASDPTGLPRALSNGMSVIEAISVRHVPDALNGVACGLGWLERMGGER